MLLFIMNVSSICIILVKGTKDDIFLLGKQMLVFHVTPLPQREFSKEICIIVLKLKKSESAKLVIDTLRVNDVFRIFRTCSFNMFILVL